MPVPATIPAQQLGPGGGETDAVGCAGIGDPTQSVGEAAPLNLRARKGSSSPINTTTAVVGKPAADFLGVLPAADILGAGLEDTDDQTMKPVDEALAQARPAEPKPADGLPGPAPQIGPRAETNFPTALAAPERQAPPDAPTAPAATPAVAPDGNGALTSVGPTASVTTQVAVVTGADVAATASSFQASAVSKPTGQRAGGRKGAAPEEVSSGPAEQKATESGQSPARFAVDSAAQKADGPGRARWSYQPEEGAAEDDSFPAAPQNAASPAAGVPAVAPALAATAPHSAAASPLPLERTASPTASPAEANPAPAPPALPTTQILQRMDKSEIHIGLQSADFGAIRLHTTVANDQVGAVVSTSHAALRDALLVEAPSLQKAIARHSLRLDSVDIGAGGGGSGSNSNSFGNNERKQSGTGPFNGSAWTAAEPRQSQSAGASVAASVDGSYRLDVRA